MQLKMLTGAADGLKVFPTRLRVRRARGGPIAAEPAAGPADETGMHMVTCVVAQDDGIGEVPMPLDRAGALARRRRGFVWIPLDPTGADPCSVAREFGFPERASTDLGPAHERPKLDVHTNLVVAVIKPVQYAGVEEAVQINEIAVFLGPSFVITVEHGAPRLLDSIRSAIGDGNGNGNPPPSFGPTEVLYQATQLAVQDYLEALQHIEQDVEELEKKVFGVASDDHAEQIYKLKREVGEFRRMVTPLARSVERLGRGQIDPVDSGAAHSFAGVHEHLVRVAEGIDAVDRQLSDILDANLARVSVEQNRIALRQNEDMRKISAWAAIALVPTATAGIYGMNFEHMPELQWTFGYPAALTGIAAACTVLYRAFRRNHWL